MKKLILSLFVLFTLAFTVSAQVAVNVKGGFDWLFKNYEFYDNDFPQVKTYTEMNAPTFDFVGIDALLQLNGGIENPVGFVVGLGIGYVRPAIAEWLTAGLVFNIETNYLLIQPNILLDLGLSETLNNTYFFSMAEFNVSISPTDGPSVVFIAGVNFKSHFDTGRYMMMPYAVEVGLGYRFDD